MGDVIYKININKYRLVNTMHVLATATNTGNVIKVNAFAIQVLWVTLVRNCSVQAIAQEMEYV